MLPQSGEKVNHVRSKGHVSSTLLITSCFGVVFFQGFRKEYNDVNFMGNDLERRLFDTSVLKLS